MWTRRLPIALALTSLLLLPACPGSDGGDAEETSKDSKAGKDGKKAKPKKNIPAEPLPLDVKPVTGDTKLPVDVTVSLDGKAVRLGDLLAGNSIVLFSDADTRDKDNRAAQRAIRYLSHGASPMGFRLVAIFKDGTSDAEIDAWYTDRKIHRTGRAVVDDGGAFAKASGWSPRTLALVGEDGQIGELFLPTEGWDARVGYDGGANADLLFRAWEPAQGAPAVSAAAKKAALGVVRAVLDGEPVTEDSALPTVDDPALASPPPGRVFVSLYRPATVRRLRGEGTGATLGEAIAAATKDALMTAGTSAPGWQAVSEQLRFAVDVAGPDQQLPTRELRALWYLLEPGIDGIIVRKGDTNEGVVLPHEAVTEGLLTPRVRDRDAKTLALVREAAIRASLSKSDWKADDTTLHRFRTTSFGANVAGATEPVDMVRGNVLIDGPPDEAAILESLRIGGLWLVNTVGEDGKFDYEYFPNQAKGSSGYNIVRHAGSVYGLFEMAHLAHKEPALAADRNKYLDAAARAMGYIYDATESPNGDEAGDRRCLISNNSCESGSAALTLLTFLSRPEPSEVPAEFRDRIYRDEDKEIMEGLGLVLTDMIDPSGKVFYSYRESLKFDRVRKEPLYYPGETMLALLMFHDKTQDPRWLEGARRIGDRQVEYYDKKRFSWPDHWVMQGLYELWQETKDNRYAETAYAMATHSEADQYAIQWTPFADYHGAWRRKKDVPRTTRAGSRLEAVRRVVHLAWEAGEDATAWEEVLIRGADHLIEKQYRPENVWWIPYPDKVMGAYPMGIVDNHIRIDNNQHALVGMLGALEVLRRRAQ